MRREQQDNLYKKYGKKLVNQYVKEIPVEDITSYDQSARGGADHQSNIEHLFHIFTKGIRQEFPCDLRRVGKSLVVMDGCNRYLAKLREQKFYDDEGKGRKAKIKVSTFLDEHLNYNDAQWEDWQDEANDHEPQCSNTEQNMKDGVTKRVKNRFKEIVMEQYNKEVQNNPKLKEPNFTSKKVKDVNANCKLFGRWLNEGIYKNSKYTATWFSNRAKEAYENEALVETRRSWSNDRLKQEYAKDGNFGWVKDDDKKHLVSARNAGRAYPNVAGFLVEQTIKYPDCGQHIVIAIDKLANKSSEDIKEERNKIKEEVEKMRLAIQRLDGKPLSRWTLEYANQIDEDKGNFTVIWDSNNP